MVEGEMANSTLVFILGIAGFIIGLCFAVIGFFLKMVHSDVRKNTEETGRNKGRFEQLELQLESEKEMRIKENEMSNKLTQQSLQQLTKEISNLTQSVQLVIADKIKGE